MPDQVHRRHAAQRRDPHQRAGGDGAFAAAQEPVPDRLRRLRRNWAAFPVLANQFSREQILRYVYEEAPTVVNEAKTRPADFVSEQRSQLTLAGIAQRRPRARPGGGRGLSTSPAARPRQKSRRRPSAHCWKASCRPKAACWRPTWPCATSARARPRKPADLGFTEFKRPHQVHARPESLPARARHRLHGPRHARRLRGALPRRQHALHRAVSARRRACATRARKSSRRCAPTSPRRTRRKSARILAGIPDPVGTFYRYGLAEEFTAAQGEPAG